MQSKRHEEAARLRGTRTREKGSKSSRSAMKKQRGSEAQGQEKRAASPAEAPRRSSKAQGHKDKREVEQVQRKRHGAARLRGTRKSGPAEAPTKERGTRTRERWTSPAEAPRRASKAQGHKDKLYRAG